MMRLEDELSCFPKPIQIVLKAFKEEFRAGVRRLIQRMDLVTKDEFLVQRKLLDEAYAEIERLKHEQNSN